MKLINPDKLPIYAGFVYLDQYHIATEKCQVVKYDDIVNAEAYSPEEHHDATEAAYNHGFTDGYEKGSRYTAHNGWHPPTEQPEPWQWIITAYTSPWTGKETFYAALMAAPEIFEQELTEYRHTVTAWRYLEEIQ